LGYKVNAVLVFFGILFVVSVLVLIFDSQRHAGIPPKISVEPDSLFLKLNNSETVIKLVKIDFEENAIEVNASLQGPGLTKFINLTKVKNSNTDYSLYVNATNPSNNDRPMILEGDIKIVYSFADQQPHEKNVSLQAIIRNTTSLK
jgi:hypothetical protein